MEETSTEVPIRLSREAATAELQQIEAWLTDVQQKVPAAQQRGMWLQGYLAALDGG